MPYIRPNQRVFVDAYDPTTAGELNYAITRRIMTYVGHKHGKHSYADLNDVLGALESAKLEFVRRVVVPYEDRKRAENGDVYDAILVE